MSVLNLMKNYDNLSSEVQKCVDDEITGAKNPIKQFVEAKKGESNQVNKGKVGILKAALTKMKGSK